MNIINKFKEFREKKRAENDAKRTMQAQAATKELKRQKKIAKQEATIKEAKKAVFENSTVGKITARIKEIKETRAKQSSKASRRSVSVKSSNPFSMTSNSSGAAFYSSGSKKSAGDFYRR